MEIRNDGAYIYETFQLQIKYRDSLQRKASELGELQQFGIVHIISSNKVNFEVAKLFA